MSNRRIGVEIKTLHLEGSGLKNKFLSIEARFRKLHAARLNGVVKYNDSEQKLRTSHGLGTRGG